MLQTTWSPTTRALSVVVELVSLVAVAALVASCGGSTAEKEAEAPPQTGKAVLVNEIPHDPTAFTEGLVLDGSVLYESTGDFGKSTIRTIDPNTGAVTNSVALEPDLFGEGVAAVGDRLWQLTFRNGFAIERDRASLRELQRVPMTGEGWGLCYDGSRLIRSDGTDTLHFHDPNTFAETGTVSVTIDGKPQRRLNELECEDGQVWANVMPSEQIVRIDPESGDVTATVDAAGLLDPVRRSKTDVMNGIAAMGNGEYLLTGKYWPSMFRVRFELQ
ncbi:glutaminyl-peptide cyclotransferase [Mycolicibacterium sediminis]|uniref:Glutaminyl-peptide cyclotransferase n=1 Tax=Mycolicibacterium sediminis TaxID=1286180 RepID=A0A7I7QYG4_9MYCO|nr:glutaminyl-peptide cyclotransferase [Mycolicibacterium sediminis]BBY31315.1 glutaminyl-peptide cyclotransferase [Mycolicibacterium sediminis]